MQLPDFAHVVVVVFENHEASSIAGNPDAPTFNALARHYATLTDYTAVTHPSLPNYLALVSGSTHGIRTDCTTCLVSGRNLADSLERPVRFARRRPRSHRVRHHRIRRCARGQP